MGEKVTVLDCDGHIIESIPEMVEYIDARIRHIALTPSRNRQGVFAQLDSSHYPRNLSLSEEERKPSRRRALRPSRPITSMKWISWQQSK